MLSNKKICHSFSKKDSKAGKNVEITDSKKSNLFLDEMSFHYTTI